ncbi:hypothetical protein [Microbacterium sp. NPDC057650]|uniref:hypothetical protein n=1 Tax=unclassified Microbacterium TaxID=2609290 RepID=UPI003670AA18
MSRTSVPGPLRRLLRQPLRVTSVVLLSTTAIAAAGVHGGAATMLASTVDENWRGDYDILVTASEQLADVDGMLPPNALSGGGAGMSLNQWQRVQKLDGVDVAAPIGEVLVPALKRADVWLAIPEEKVRAAAAAPEAYRLTTTYTTDDGLGERIVDRRSIPLVFDGTAQPSPNAAEIETCRANAGTVAFGLTDTVQVNVDPARYPALVENMCGASGWRIFGTGPSVNFPSDDAWSSRFARSGDDAIAFNLPAVPDSTTRITLVDPESERHLLGDRGAFLDPLIDVDTTTRVDIDRVSSWAEQKGGTSAEQLEGMLRDLIHPSDSDEETVREWRQLYAENDLDYDAAIRASFEGEGITPLIVNEAQIAQLTVRVDLEAFGPTEHAAALGYVVPESVTSGAPGVEIGSTAGDVSGILNPFSSAADVLTWPGEDAGAKEDVTLSAYGRYLRVVGKQEGAGFGEAPGGGVRLDATGFIDPMRPANTPEGKLHIVGDGTRPGVESMYAEPRIISDASTRNEDYSLALPIGSFDPADLGVDEDAADHVPLGAYAPVGTTLTAGDHAGTTMRPSLSGLGLVSARTVAIGSIHSAAYWNDKAPISAIRVRVAGIDGYDDAGRQRVIEVARSIERLGLTATIVAGSSPADADVHVNGYAFGTDDPAGSQEVATLGTMTQKWSELGAAARVSLSISAASWAVLAIALGAGVLMMIATQLAAVPGRRDQSLVMREIGFRRSRIMRWFAGEELPGILVVFAIALGAWLLSGRSAVSTISSVVAMAAITVGAGIAVVSASRTRSPGTRDARSRTHGARTVFGFGIRQLGVHPLTAVVQLVAIVVIGLAAGAVAESARTGQSAIGLSSLAVLVAAQQLGPQLVLGGIGVIGGVLLARITRRTDLARRAEQWEALRAMGWTGRQIARAQRAEGLAIALPALLVVAVIVTTAITFLEVAWYSAAIALAAGALSALVTFAFRPRGASR